MINGLTNMLSGFAMNGSGSSIFSSLVCAGGLSGTLTKIGNFLFGMIYTVAKYLLYFVDLLFSYIQKLCGLDMSMESLDEMLSAESDIVFNLLISGRDLVTIIIRNLIILAVVMIIIFAIIAIIKGQYDAMKKNSHISPFTALKTSFKAFILLLITPFITIGGIIASDLLLQTLYNATNVSGAMSLGTQVFLTSSTSANAYRIYAQNDKRIPIVFDNTKNAEINNYFDENSVSEGFVKYLLESKNSGGEVNPIYATYMSFLTSDFTRFSAINNVVYPNNGRVQREKKTYDTYYDFYVGAENEGNLSFKEFRKIDSYAEEYYVMADVIDFCVQTGNTVYMKTIEQVLDSVASLNDDVDKESIFKLLLRQYEIKFYTSYDYDAETGKYDLYDEIYVMPPDGTVDPNYSAIEKYNNEVKGNNVIISFMSDYLALSDSGDPEIRMQIRVNHIVGETNELRGAKFIIATENSVYNSNGVPQNYFEPLVNGYSNIGNNEFRSDYIRNGNIIVAKGIFKDSKYPTAIRMDAGSKLVFFREDIEAEAVGQMGEYVSLSVEQKGGLFGRLIKMIQALFDPSTLVPKVEVDLDAMQLTYEKSGNPAEVDTLVDGKIRLGYFMKANPTFPSSSKANNFCFAFTELYQAQKLNFLILLVGSFLLLRVCLSAITSLIERSYELFLLFLTYPAACATIPIDDGGAYNTWIKGYFARIFRTYGFLLGINFVLMIFPVIQNMTFFTQDEIGTTKIVRRVGVLFFNVLTVRQITNLMNLATAVMFELVAFTLIETVPEVISTIVSGKESALKIKDNNVFTKIKDTGKKFAMSVGKVVLPPLKGLEYLTAGEAKKKNMRRQLKNKVMNSVGLDAFTDMTKFIPGIEIYKDASNKINQMKTQQAQKQAEKDLFEKLNDPNASKDDIKRALADYQSKAVQASSQGGKKTYKCEAGHGVSDGDLSNGENARKNKYIQDHLSDAKTNNPDKDEETLKNELREEYMSLDVLQGGTLCPSGGSKFCPVCARDGHKSALKKIEDKNSGKEGSGGGSEGGK